MRVGVGVLTWNPMSTGRMKLLVETVESLEANQPDLLVVADNGSVDDFDIGRPTVRFPRLPGFPPGNTCGYGMNKLAATLFEADVDLVVLSNDDIRWKPSAVATLEQIWEEASNQLVVLSGLVEPTFALPGERPWNEPVAADTIAGHKVLFRRSVPGGAWSYRNEDYTQIFPVSTFAGTDDVPACHRLVDAGRLVGCVDVADHAGAGLSTWGNGSDRFMVEPLEAVRARFGL